MFQMFDLKNGVITLFGVKLSANTPPAAIEALPDALVSKKTSKYGHKHFKFQQYLPADGVQMRLEVLFYAGEKVPQANLYPVIPDSVKDPAQRARCSLEASRRWLKAMIRDAAGSELEESISYPFGAGYIYAGLRHSRDYGLLGGEIRVRFED